MNPLRIIHNLMLFLGIMIVLMFISAGVKDLLLIPKEYHVQASLGVSFVMAGLFTEKLPQDFLKFFWLDGNHPITHKIFLVIGLVLIFGTAVWVRL